MLGTMSYLLPLLTKLPCKINAVAGLKKTFCCVAEFQVQDLHTKVKCLGKSKSLGHRAHECCHCGTLFEVFHLLCCVFVWFNIVFPLFTAGIRLQHKSNSFSNKLGNFGQSHAYSLWIVHRWLWYNLVSTLIWRLIIQKLTTANMKPSSQI